MQICIFCPRPIVWGAKLWEPLRFHPHPAKAHRICRVSLPSQAIDCLDLGSSWSHGSSWTTPEKVCSPKKSGNHENPFSKMMTPPGRVQCWHLQDPGTSKNQAWFNAQPMSSFNQPPTCEQEGHFGRPLRLGRLPKKHETWIGSGGCVEQFLSNMAGEKEIDGFGIFWPIENGGCSLFFIWFWPIEHGGCSYCQVGSYEVTQLWQKPLGSDALKTLGRHLRWLAWGHQQPQLTGNDPGKKKRDAVRSWYQFFDGEYPSIKQLTNQTINQPINQSTNQPTNRPANQFIRCNIPILSFWTPRLVPARVGIGAAKTKGRHAHCWGLAAVQQNIFHFTRGDNLPQHAHGKSWCWSLNRKRNLTDIARRVDSYHLQPPSIWWVNFFCP